MMMKYPTKRKHKGKERRDKKDQKDDDAHGNRSQMAQRKFRTRKRKVYASSWACFRSSWSITRYVSESGT